MTALISKSDVELEMQCTLPAAYTTDVIAGYSAEAEADVQYATNRTSFTGPSAYVYKRAVLLAIVMRIGASIPAFLKSNISSISEQGDSISFRSGDGYRAEFDGLIKRLALRPVTSAACATTNDETFYRPATEGE